MGLSAVAVGGAGNPAAPREYRQVRKNALSRSGPILRVISQVCSLARQTIHPFVPRIRAVQPKI
jgi:hypothetical protein